MRDIFNAPSREDAEELKDKVVKKFEKIAPEFVSWLEDNLDEGLTVFDFPRSWWRRILRAHVTARVFEHCRPAVVRDRADRGRSAQGFPPQASQHKSCYRLRVLPPDFRERMFAAASRFFGIAASTPINKIPTLGSRTFKGFPSTPRMECRRTSKRIPTVFEQHHVQTPPP